MIPPGSVPNTTTKAYIYSGGSFGGAYTMRAAGWTPSAATVPTAPGDGFFIQNTAATPITITFTAVSYTHLDVYKRQLLRRKNPRGWARVHLRCAASFDIPDFTRNTEAG